MSQHSQPSIELFLWCWRSRRNRSKGLICGCVSPCGALRVGDFISSFGGLRPDADARFRQMLLLKQPSHLRSGRVPIFVCPECADYGCGVVTAAVAKDGDFAIWDSFATENNYSEEVHACSKHRQQIKVSPERVLVCDSHSVTVGARHTSGITISSHYPLP